MKRIITLAFCIFAFSLCTANFATAQPVQKPVLRASVSANATVLPEHGAHVVLEFSLVGDTEEAMVAAAKESKLFINDREALYWAGVRKDNLHNGFGPRPKIVQGQPLTFTSDDSDLRQNFRGPGTYRVRWVVANFRAPEITIRVLPDIVRDDEPVSTTLLRSLRARLPRGWDVFTENEFSETIEVIRLQPTLMGGRAMPNAHRAPRNEVSQWALNFELVPYVSPAEYARLKAENVEINKNLAAASEKMQHISHKYDSFLPDNDADRKLVEEYDRLKASRHELPRYYFGRTSLAPALPRFRPGDEGRLEYHYLYVIDKAARAECREVTKLVFSVLSFYEAKPSFDDTGDDDGVE